MATDTRTPAPRRPTETTAVDAPTTVLPMWSRASETLSITLRQPPRMRQLVVVCAWAALLGCVGLAIGLRALFGVLADTPPAWFEPTIALVGVTGIALSVGAFLTIRRTGLPYVLLTLATGVLASALVLTISAF